MIDIPVLIFIFSGMCNTTVIKVILRKVSSLFSLSFEFVKAIGGDVTPVNLSTGQEINLKVLLGIAKQGPVYVRAMRRLPVCAFVIMENI